MLEEQKVFNGFLEENLHTGCIHPSNSSMTSPLFFILKTDGSLQMIKDYGKLNEYMIKNWYSLPLIQEHTDKLHYAKFFTKLNIRWEYNDILIKEGDKWKAAFCTNRGLFKPTVMPFGLGNPPSTFQ